MTFTVRGERPSLRGETTARVRRAVCALAVGTVCVGLEARAQESGAAEAIALEEIAVEGKGGATRGYQPVSSSTATGVETPILDTPQSIAVISNEVIRDQAANSLDDALVNASGVTQTNTLGGTQDAFIRRGFGDNRDGSVMTDGLRTALPRSFNATTERVEVLKGPSSALFGILDPGGLINLVTKKPEETFGGSLEVQGTSFGGGQGAIDVTGPLEGTNLSYRVIGSYQNTDYWKEFGTHERGLIAPSLAWRGENTSIVLSYLHEDYKVPFDRGTVFDTVTDKPLDIARRKRLDERFNITDGTTDVASIKLEHAFNDQWKLNAAYTYSHNAYSDYQARVSGYTPGTGAIGRTSDGTQGSKLDVHAARTDLAGDVTLGGLRHQLLFGAAYDFSDVKRADILRCPEASTATVIAADIDNWSTLKKCSESNPRYSKLQTYTSSDQRERLETWSAYAQDSIYLTDRLIAIGGLRFQKYEVYAGRGRFDAALKTDFKAATDGEGDKLVPRIGGVFKLTPEISLFAMWSQSFKPQSSTSQEVGPLKPEEGESYEAGVKFEALQGLTATASVYHIVKQNVVFGSGDDLEVSKEVRSRGFELDVAGQVTEHVSIIASYGYTDAVTTDGEFKGKRPVNVAKHTASLFASYDFGEVWGPNTLKVGGGVRGVSRRPGQGDNAYFLTGYAVVDAFAAYRIAATYPVTVQLNLKNLFDRTYYASSIGTNAFANAIGEPFQALVSARVDF